MKSDQQYLDVVNLLLECEEGKEKEILEKNTKMIDFRLVRMMISVVDVLKVKGDENNARWLEQEANRLKPIIYSNKHLKANSNAECFIYYLQREYGEDFVKLACHVAICQEVTLNFCKIIAERFGLKVDINLLFDSGLYEEAGYLCWIAKENNCKKLLEELDFSFGRERLDELANFIIETAVKKMEDAPSISDEYEAEIEYGFWQFARWAALLQAKTKIFEEEICLFLKEAIKKRDKSELFRGFNIIDSAAKMQPPKGINPLIINYSKTTRKKLQRIVGFPEPTGTVTIRGVDLELF